MTIKNSLPVFLHKSKLYFRTPRNGERTCEKESFSLIPSFVDDKIAEKITSGLSKYFEEVEQDPNHALRKEITQNYSIFLLKSKSILNTNKNSMR